MNSIPSEHAVEEGTRYSNMFFSDYDSAEVKHHNNMNSQTVDIDDNVITATTSGTIEGEADILCNNNNINESIFDNHHHHHVGVEAYPWPNLQPYLRCFDENSTDELVDHPNELLAAISGSSDDEMIEYDEDDDSTSKSIHTLCEGTTDMDMKASSAAPASASGVDSTVDNHEQQMQMVMTSLFDKEVIGDLLDNNEGDKEGILNNSMSMFDHNHGNVAGVDDDAVEHAVTMTTANTKTKRDKKWLENYCELQVREESYSYIMLLLLSPQYQQSTSISSYLSLPHQKRFKQQNGHCYVPRSYKTSKHLALGEWVDRQRRFMRRYDESTNKSSDTNANGMLEAEERYELLHLIGLKSLGGE